MEAESIHYRHPHPPGGYKNQISPREKQVIEGVLLGYTNKQIGFDLGITEKTIKFHLTKIYKKLKVKHRHALMVLEAQKKNSQK